MKKNLLITVLSLMIMMTLAAAGVVYAGIKGSKHDFSVGATAVPDHSQFAGVWGPADPDFGPGYVVAIDEICVFCHTPHGASSAGVLWNRLNTESMPSGITEYRLYSSSTLTTGPSDFSQLSPISRMCLSCHDGVTSIGAAVLINPPGKSLTADIELEAYVLSGVTPPGSIGMNSWWVGANIGDYRDGRTYIDLSNDHPISVPIPGKQGYQTPSNPNLRLFNGGKVECATCHNVHSNDIPPFLSMDNSTQSAMCFQCHSK